MLTRALMKRLSALFYNFGKLDGLMFHFSLQRTAVAVERNSLNYKYYGACLMTEILSSSCVRSRLLEFSHCSEKLLWLLAAGLLGDMKVILTFLRFRSWNSFMVQIVSQSWRSPFEILLRCLKDGCIVSLYSLKL